MNDTITPKIRRESEPENSNRNKNIPNSSSTTEKSVGGTITPNLVVNTTPETVSNVSKKLDLPSPEPEKLVIHGTTNLNVNQQQHTHREPITPPIDTSSVSSQISSKIQKEQHEKKRPTNKKQSRDHLPPPSPQLWNQFIKMKGLCPLASLRLLRSEKDYLKRVITNKKRI